MTQIVKPACNGRVRLEKRGTVLISRRTMFECREQHAQQPLRTDADAVVAGPHIHLLSMVTVKGLEKTADGSAALDKASGLGALR